MSILYLVLLAAHFIDGISEVRAGPYQVQCLSKPFASTVYVRSRFTFTSYFGYTEYPDGILLSTNITNDVLTLEFRYVEFGPDCSTSYVKVYEGQSSNGRLLKTFCGTKGQDITSTGQYVFVEYTSAQTDRRFKLGCQSIPSPSESSSKTKGIAGGVVAVLVAVCVVVCAAYRYKRGPFCGKDRNRIHRNNIQVPAAPPTANVININTPVTYPANPSTNATTQYNSYPPNAQYQPQSQDQHPPPYPVQAQSQYQPQNPELYPPSQRDHSHYPPQQPQTRDLYPPSGAPYAANSAFPQQPTAPPLYTDPPPPYPS